jgi:purine-binding chemotaxis protein CheW
MNVVQKKSGPLRAVQEPRINVGSGSLQLLELELAGQSYGIPVRDVQEVVPMVELVGSPDLPAVIAGFLNLEGKMIPVLRLDRMLRQADRPTGIYTPLIILRTQGGRLALIADRVSRIRTVAEEEVLPLPENHSFNDCVVGMVTSSERVLLVLMPARLLLQKEQKCVTELQNREHERLLAMGGA